MCQNSELSTRKEASIYMITQKIGLGTFSRLGVAARCLADSDLAGENPVFGLRECVLEDVRNSTEHLN